MAEMSFTRTQIIDKRRCLMNCNSSSPYYYGICNRSWYTKRFTIPNKDGNTLNFEFKSGDKAIIHSGICRCDNENTYWQILYNLAQADLLDMDIYHPCYWY